MENQGKYLKLYEEVRDDIVEGVYPYGTKLPSKRVMADRKQLSVITVTHAYELLAEEGYIAAKEKSGYFVSYDEKTYFASPGGLHQVSVPEYHRVSMPITDEDAFSFSIYAKTARRVLSEYFEAVMESSPFEGLEELRGAIAGYLSRSRRIKVTPEQIIVGSGAEYLYGLLVEAFGRDIIYGIESPSYKKIEAVYSAGGARIEELALGKDGIESEALAQSQAKVLHISPYRSFPSGVMASAAKKREYLRWMKERDAVIVEDDYESEFSPSRKPEESLFSLDTEGRVIYINTFSQTIGSFLRCAYMIIPMPLLLDIKKKIGFHACPVPTPEQLIITELINNGDFERHINRIRRKRKKNA